MKRIIKPSFAAGALLVFSVLPISKLPPPIFPDIGQAGGQNIPNIEAKSALALDLLTDEIIFEKNIHEPLPLASLTKIISSLVIVDHIFLNEYIEITKKAISTPEPSSLKVGEYIRAEDLLAMAMGESSNDAITALVEHLGSTEWFLELMRQKTVGYGLSTTNFTFVNPTGLDIKLGLDQLAQTEFGAKERAGNYSSAYGIAQIIKNSLDSIIWQVGNKEEFTSKEGIAHKIKHTNLLRKELAGIFGAKTGFTDNAGGNLVLIIERPLGKLKLIIILGSILEERFEDAKKLVTLLK